MPPSGWRRRCWRSIARMIAGLFAGRRDRVRPPPICSRPPRREARVDGLLAGRQSEHRGHRRRSGRRHAGAGDGAGHARCLWLADRLRCLARSLCRSACGCAATCPKPCTRTRPRRRPPNARRRRRLGLLRGAHASMRARAYGRGRHGHDRHLYVAQYTTTFAEDTLHMADAGIGFRRRLASNAVERWPPCFTAAGCRITWPLAGQ